MNDLPELSNERETWAGIINSFQNDRSGYYKKTFTRFHPKEHTTAYAVAALKLLGKKPPVIPQGIIEISSKPGKAKNWLRYKVPWSVIWPGSHIVAGVPAVLAMTDAGNEDFYRWYFDWLDERVNRKYGLWMRGFLHRTRIIARPTKHEMGGAFHMFFIYEYLGRDWKYPEKVIDSALSLQHANGLWDGDVSYCIDLDGVYCLTRSSHRTNGYRREDIRNACIRYMDNVSRSLNDKEFVMEKYPVTHPLPGALAAIAECCREFPELFKYPEKWVQTLDSACYI